MSRTSDCTLIGAYIAEDYRSGLASVPRGQIEAGLATGLSRRQRMLPTLFNQFVRLLKFTSVASVIGVMEFTGAGTYLVVCTLLSLVGRRLDARAAIHT